MKIPRNLGAIGAVLIASSLAFGARGNRPAQVQEGKEPRRSIKRNEGKVEVQRTLSGKAQVCKNIENDEIFVRYDIERGERWRANKMIAQTQMASRHPCHIMPLVAVKHRDGVCTIDAEYADAGYLMIYNPTTPPHMREIAAKSIFRQLVTGLHYFDVVHDLQHRDISPNTVFLRRDGCVKLGFFDVIEPTLVLNNPDWYLRSPYCPPEIRNEPEDRIHEARCRTDSKGDVWMIGVTVVSVLTGKTLLPKVAKGKGGDDPKPEHTVGQERTFQKEIMLIDELAIGDEAKWRETIEDAQLRYVVQRCLHKEPEKRATLAELNALVSLFGGVKQVAPESDPNNGGASAAGPNPAAAPDLAAAGDDRAGKSAASAVGPDLAAAGDDRAGKSAASAVNSDLDDDGPGTSAASAVGSDLDDDERVGRSATGNVTPIAAAEAAAPIAAAEAAPPCIPPGQEHLSLVNPFTTPSDGLLMEQRIESAGPSISKELEEEYKIAYHPVTGDVIMTPKLLEKARYIATLLHLELQSWRRLRDDAGSRATVDKAMRDVVKKRLKYAWKAEQKAVQLVREAAAKAIEDARRRNQEAQAQERNNAAADDGAPAAAQRQLRGRR